MNKAVLFLALLAPGLASGQQSGSADTTPAGTVPTSVNFPTERVQKPTAADLYCSGFVSKPLSSKDKFVAGGLESPFTARFVNNDAIYLNGKGYEAGQEYTVVRELRDTNRYELFKGQWAALKAYATAKGVKIIGDAPIFVSGDSADVWANPELFLLNKDRGQTVEAGVPPDYFSATGQLWGNPIYDWKAVKRTGYAWWIARFKMNLTQVDLIRLDHFRGFAAAWHVPAGSATAVKGEWVPGPGADLFRVLRRELGALPLIAEDLGVITKDVEKLRDSLGLPGMRVLQFAFSDPNNKYLPHQYDYNCAVYPGTHDNDTTRGWYAGLTDSERDFVRRYLARDGSDIAWDLIRQAWSSTADLAIAALQDVLNLGTEARMNMPSKADGNWRWRFNDGELTESILERLAELTVLFGRA